jgi:2-oxoglutarate dehydrogenase E2 component (dihydrolipoamide succinyltransferase)
MPQLGETVTEGTITRWLKQVGDHVDEDEILYEVSTDKVDSEVPSPLAGVVSEILVPEGETVDVGTRLAVITDGPAAAAGASPGTEAGGTTSDVAEPSPGDGAAEPARTVPAADPVGAAVVDRQPPAAASTAEEVGDPGAGRDTERRNGATTRPADARPPSHPADAGLVLSPVVRRLIAENNLDPAGIEGTGAGGRITRSDVLGLLDRISSGRSAPAAPPTPAPVVAPGADREPGVGVRPPSETPAPAVTGAAGERDTIVPFTNIRRRIAEHMVRSKHTSAHTMVAFEVDYHGVDRVRGPQRAAFREAEGFGLTYLPFVSRAVVDALAEFPNVNSSVGEDVLVVHHDINLGIAVDLDFDGLLVPVIHNADGKRLRALAREISALAGKARAKKLTMDDIAGGTFTITNPGPFGSLLTVPVINQPQVAILSTDGVRKRPVVVETAEGTDAIAIHPVGNLVLSWDHRAFDGAYAAAFLGRIKEILETRDWAAEL